MAGPPDTKPQSEPAPSGPMEWLDRVRARHRGKRTVGVVGCLIGALMMLFGRFRPDLAPHWMLMAGLAIVGACWLLFGWIMFDRWRWVKANPYQRDRS